MAADTDLLDFPLTGGGPLSRAARSRGHSRFAQVAEEIQALPYRRVRDRGSVFAVLDEGHGTCSSKHRYLAALAHESGHAEVTLMVGLYEMSDENTPGVGPVLDAESLAAVPEAHCYLVSGNRRYDFTGLAAGSRSPFESLLDECAFAPSDLLPEGKAAYHRAALAAWANARGLDPDRIWAVRERCIEALTMEAA